MFQQSSTYWQNAKPQLRTLWSIVFGTLAPILWSRRFLLIMAAILIVDSGLAGLDLAYRYADLDGSELPNWFSLSEEEGFGELFEYILTGLSSLALLRLYRQVRAPIFAVASGVFAWITIDNAVGLHEHGGTILTPLFVRTGVAAQAAHDFGEFAFMLFVGAIVLSALLWSLWRDRSAAAVYGLVLIGLIGVAATFGVGVDLLHAMIRQSSPLIDHAATFVEEFGELLSQSVAAALSLSLAPRYFRPSALDPAE